MMFWKDYKIITFQVFEKSMATFQWYVLLPRSGVASSFEITLTLIGQLFGSDTGTVIHASVCCCVCSATQGTSVHWGGAPGSANCATALRPERVTLFYIVVCNYLSLFLYCQHSKSFYPIIRSCSSIVLYNIHFYVQIEYFISLSPSYLIWLFSYTLKQFLSGVCVCFGGLTDLYTWCSLCPHRELFVFRRSYKHDGQRLPGGHEVILDLCVVGSYTWHTQKQQQLNLASKQQRTWAGCQSVLGVCKEWRLEGICLCGTVGSVCACPCLWAGCWDWRPAGCSSSQRRKADEGSEGSRPEENWERSTNSFTWPTERTKARFVLCVFILFLEVVHKSTT